MRIILPILLLLAAFGLFSFYTSPTYQEVKALETQQSQLDEALTKAKELRSLRDKLIAKRDTFSPDQMTRLQKLLPDNVDNIRLIIDINNIAARHGLPISNVHLGGSSDAAKDRGTSAIAGSGDAIGSVTLGFTVSADYDTFVSFLEDLEHSERILNVEHFSFKASNSLVTTYDLTLRTYWLH